MNPPPNHLRDAAMFFGVSLFLVFVVASLGFFFGQGGLSAQNTLESFGTGLLSLLVAPVVLSFSVYALCLWIFDFVKPCAPDSLLRLLDNPFFKKARRLFLGIVSILILFYTARLLSSCFLLEDLAKYSYLTIYFSCFM